jgi:hypothetical protein
LLIAYPAKSLFFIPFNEGAKLGDDVKNTQKSEKINIFFRKSCIIFKCECKGKTQYHTNKVFSLFVSKKVVKVNVAT